MENEHTEEQKPFDPAAFIADVRKAEEVYRHEKVGNPWLDRQAYILSDADFDTLTEHMDEILLFPRVYEVNEIRLFDFRVLRKSGSRFFSRGASSR